MTDALLTINAGSSSLKFSVYQMRRRDRPALAAKGQIEGIGTSPRFTAEDAAGQALVERRFPDDKTSGHTEFLRVLGSWLREQFAGSELIGVGHRVVHGGVDFAAPVLIDAAVVDKLAALCPLAPLHQPHNLAGIRAVAARSAGAAAGRLLRYRLPPRPPRGRRLVRAAAPVLRRGRPPLRLPRPVLRIDRPDAARGRARDRRWPGRGRPSRQRRQHVRAQAGRSVDSTMGFTALDGLPMGTRCGALDPGVVLHLIRAHGLDADAIERLLYHDCGLKGVSGISNDMRDLLASDDPRGGAGDRAVRLADRPRARRARRRARRPRWPRVHRRDRRALGRDPRAGLRRAGWLGVELDRGRQPGRRPEDLEPGQQGRGLRDCDR